VQQTTSPEIADIFRQHGADYRAKFGRQMPMVQHKAMHAIEVCRTAQLGGHKEQCQDCGVERYSYNSCRNRHCPKCQFLSKEQWIEKREANLLPIQYFHVVFTVPHELNNLVYRNQEVCYTLLFKAVASTLKKLSEDPRHLGAKIGFSSILHTWGQNLMYHPHIHCIVTGGGLTKEDTFVRCRNDFFIHVRLLSALFRGLYLNNLKKAAENGDIVCDRGFKQLIADQYKKKWVVYSKPPFNTAKDFVRYLGRYTHRIAISNNRIIKFKDGEVNFQWRDYKDNNCSKDMTLTTTEFIRRFLLHVLPKGFMRIRHYGLVSSRNVNTLLPECRKILGTDEPQKKPEAEKESWQATLLRITGIDISKCPACKTGRMLRVQTYEAIGFRHPLKMARSP
jgi:predicted Zn-ribbon and HTH transcriptional regulator